MATKEELSDKLNEILGLEETVDFSKMTKEDLEKLVDYFSDPANMLRTAIKNMRGRAKRELLERPLKDLLEADLIGIILGKRERKGGLFGFGILDRVLGEESKE